MHQNNSITKTIVVLTIIMSTMSGCSGAKPGPTTAPFFTATPPTQNPDTKQVAFQGVASRNETHWIPDKLMVNLTSDREGKRVLANTLIEPIRDGAKYNYSFQFPTPKSKGTYFFHWMLYEKPEPGRKDPESELASEPGVIEFEVN